jgi:glycosyltransferase involved in cell wall biosynthesis/SAM-dependent methyltransferase
MIRTRFARLGERWWVDTRERMLLKDMGQRTAAANAEAEGLRGDVARLSRDAEGLRGEVARLSGEAEGLRGEVARLSGEAEGLRSDVARVSSEAEGLRSDVARVSSEAEGLRGEVARQSSQVETARKAAERAWADFRTASARAFRAEEETAEFRARAERAEARGLRIETEAGKEAARAAELGLALIQVQADLHGVLGSTAWLATWPLRVVGQRLPYPLRRAVRGGAKLGWWTVTMKLPRKLRERQDAARASRQIAHEPAAPTELPGESSSSPLTEIATGTAVRARPDPHTHAPVLVYVSGEPDTPGHRYRVIRPAMAAESLGARTSWMRVEEIAARMGEIDAADALVIWRAPWDERIATAVNAARRNGAKVVFDLDDLMIAPELARLEIIDGIRTQNLTEAAVGEHYERVGQTMAAADLCLATTEELAQHMRRMGMPTVVLPNGVDHATIAASRLAARRRAAAPHDSLVRIGYACGSRTHQRDFAVCAEAVAAVLRDRPESRLVAFRAADGSLPCLDIDEFPALHGLENRIEWRNFVPLERLSEEISRFDINLAPLEIGNPFCEAKSELKFFEAALVDVPTIASPTGPFRRAVRHGETGFLAETAAEWREALLQLVDDVPLRRRVAKAARREAMWRFGPERRAELMGSLLDLLHGGRRAASAFALEVRCRDAQLREPRLPDCEIVFAADRLASAEVTVVMPLYNYANYVEEALESVRAQTLATLDLIVVDDRSTDESLAVALRWLEANAVRFNRVLLLQNTTNEGLAVTRNASIEAADTRYVLPLDPDNRLLPGCAAACLRTARDTGAAIAYPVIQRFGTESYLMGDADYDPARLLKGNYIDGMALISKAAWVAVGGYDRGRGGWEDFALLCRFVERGFWGERVPGGPLAEYRAHPTSMMHISDSQPEVVRRMMDEATGDHPWLRLIWPSAEPEPPRSQPGSAPAAEKPAFTPLCAGSRRDPVLEVQAPKVTPKQSRSEILLGPIPKDAKILEVGPGFGPVAPKSAGWKTKTLDHTTREGLVAKYLGQPGVAVDRIEEVDFVWSGGKLSDAVPADEQGTFDAVIASHVIEHMPDFISFLNSIEVFLKENGVVALAIPDKRYCFDYFRPLATTGQILACHRKTRSRHVSQLAFDYAAYSAQNGGSIAWGQHPVQELCLVNSLEAAQRFTQTVADSEEYVDMHAWCFVPASFELILFELAILHETDLRVEEITATDGCEFLCWLRHGGKAAVALLSEAERAGTRLALLKRTMLDMKVQVDWLLAGNPRLASAPSSLPSQSADTPFSPMMTTLQPAKFPIEKAAETAVDCTPATTQLLGPFDGGSRLARLLPLLRCPETGQPLVLAPSGDALFSEDGTRHWPMVMGRPVLFPGLDAPVINSDTHLSNPLPATALSMIHSISGPILHLSAGGSAERFENVIEADAAMFRHTDLICDAHRLPFADRIFDAVIALNAFEHYRDPRTAAHEIMRVLRPGGRVLIHTAFLQPLHEAPWHFYNCTRYGLEAWFEDFETEKLHVSPNFHPGYSLSWLASECELALRSYVSNSDAEIFLNAPLHRLISLWRAPESSRAAEPIWGSLAALPQRVQEGLAAGFELIGRKPVV